MTDIWRSFNGQRCLWQLGHGLVFHAPEVEQELNPHDLMVDFKAEIPGYRYIRRMVQVLEGLKLQPGSAAVAVNLLCCYVALAEADFISRAELGLVESWLCDLGLVLA